MRIIDQLKVILEKSLIEEGFVKEIPGVNYTIPAGVEISTDGGQTSRPVKDGGEKFTNGFSVFDTIHFNDRQGERNISADKLIDMLSNNKNQLMELIVNDILIGENLGDGKIIVLNERDPKGWVAYIADVKIKEVENAKEGFKLKNNTIRLITTVDKNTTKYSNKDLFYPTNTSGNARMYIYDKNGKFDVMNSNRYRKNNFNLFKR